MTANRPRVTLWALLIFGAAASACATARPPQLHVLPPRQPAADAASSAAVVQTALSYVGAPYVLGGTTPAGFDCSGFVWYVFRQHGVQLPRNVVTQVSVGREVDRSDVRAGDLVFFNTTGSGVSHVGIAIGRDSFVHAPNSRGVVRVEPLNSPYWSQHYAGARRVTPPVT